MGSDTTKAEAEIAQQHQQVNVTPEVALRIGHILEEDIGEMQAPKIGHTTKHPGGTPVPQLHPTLHVTFQNHHLRYDHNHHRLHEDRQPVNIPLHHNGSHREKKNKLPLQPDAALTAIISLHILAGLNNKTR